MPRAMTSMFSIAVIAAAAAWTSGCRLPEEDDYPGTDAGFDASVDDDAGPGAVCPAGTEDLFNNAFSPYEGGDESVLLEVVDYSFFKCPHCAAFSQSWEQIWADNPEFRAHVRLYFHHFPFDYQSAWDTHAATVAAGNQGMEYFWQLHDYIFDGLYYDGVAYSLDEIRAYCENTLGLEMTQFDADMADPYTYAFLEWDKEQAQAVGVTGTPSVFVCGEKIKWGDLEEIVSGYLGE
jgi:hypothetical protein